MGKRDFVMHVEASRSFVFGTSTTLCGLTFKVEKATRGGRIDCATCKALKAAKKRGNH
ncbi:hypothetical protein SAMN05192558_109318 [Actinokineospora alba]|uniref:Uncharacterized protein n=1 Tax=Actinokineospora alba TaxID=504798 RepID=A0A1H0T7W4_9PSEU|nr:hypothetical protein [Actinokineospora alba]TDP66321.1 hypothetical protein C8E96_1822 [Actinokineospora alba]SDJ21939.1 hypothetical protein SAMN05421871_11157 [Actinokineospora alba]SDP50143.1 hypothetical protein SAMN05192558_109318 [Actinokineospora alba]